MSLSKHQILASDDLGKTEVAVPEWNGSVYIKTLSLADGIDFQSKLKDTDDEKVFALFLTYALTDAEGKPLFTTADVDDLLKKNKDVIIRLFNDAITLNKMGNAAEVEREEKS